MRWLLRVLFAFVTAPLGFFAGGRIGTAFTSVDDGLAAGATVALWALGLAVTCFLVAFWAAGRWHSRTILLATGIAAAATTVALLSLPAFR